MQCRDAHFYLRLRRHANDELGDDLISDLDRHLAGCPDCAIDSRNALIFDRAVASAMKSVVIPAGLRDKLLTQVMVHQGNRLRRSAYRMTALAASLLLVLGLGFGMFSASRPKLDTDALVRSQDEQIQNPEHAIKHWLTAQHFPDQLPLPFNPDLLLLLGSERVQGRDVPVIVFGGAVERGYAKVYLFRSTGEFNIDPKDLRDAQASNTRAIVKKLPQAPGVVYVVVYTGHDLQPFLQAVQATL